MFPRFRYRLPFIGRVLSRLRPSPSRDAAAFGHWLIGEMKRGIEATEARRAELLASGMSPEEARAVLWREMYTDPGFPAFLAHAEGVAKRSFRTLYEDDEED